MRRALIRHRPAFTLVELLMVITIIGILIGLLVPTVFYAMKSIKARAIGIELQTIASAIDQYKNKYGDYPPDGSSVVDFQRHYRNLFKTMAESEFTAVASAANANNGAGATGYMDPPEALVFALGGFSSDPVHPFTGPGGPIIVIPGSPPTIQYNVDRNSPLYDFKDSQLTIDSSSGLTLSIDETLYGLGSNDAMPVYKAPYGKIAPFVYFRATTYKSGSAPFWNNYGSSAIGYCRPYRSDKLNTSVAATPINADKYYRYMNDSTFQLISAGLDDSFGGIAYTGSSGGPTFFRYPSGDEISFAGYPSSAPTFGTTTRYSDGDASHPQFDNVANFADGTLEDGLSN